MDDVSSFHEITKSSLPEGCQKIVTVNRSYIIYNSFFFDWGKIQLLIITWQKQIKMPYCFLTCMYTKKWARLWIFRYLGWKIVRAFDLYLNEHINIKVCVVKWQILFHFEKFGLRTKTDSEIYSNWTNYWNFQLGKLFREQCLEILWWQLAMII